MAEEQEITVNTGDIAEQLANLRGGDAQKDIEKLKTQEEAGKEAPKVEPKAEVISEEGDRTLDPDLPDRDDIVIKKKREAKSESGDEIEAVKTESEPNKDPEPEFNDDDDSDDDGSDVDEPASSGGSENFKKLRKSQKEYKKKAAQLEKQVEELKPLKKYRDIVDLALSPEFHDTYSGARERMVEQAQEIGDLYGVSPEDLKQVFEAENIKQAKGVLGQIVEDADVSSELNTVIRDFYINKTKEEKELQVADPKARFQQLKEEREKRIAQVKAQKIESISLAKTKTSDDLNILLGDPKQAEQLWSGVFNKDLKKYIETNLPEKFKDQATKNYNALYDSLVNKGAELSFDDSRKIAMLTADASMGIMANKVIGILLDRLHVAEKEMKTQTSNANPLIRESRRVDSSSKDETPLTREDKVLDLVKGIVG